MRPIILVFLMCLVGGVLVLLTNQPKALAAWWNDSFQYRQSITVTVATSTSDITNLETLLTVNTSALISSKLQSNCADLRFVSQQGKQLPYYIDSGCNSTTTKVWVMMDLVPKNTTTYTLYMYYGNPGVAAATDPVTFWKFINLKGYWPMNESSWNGTSGEVKDASIGGNNGTSVNSATTTTGKYGNAGTFNGSNNYASSTTAAPTTTVSSWTLSAWIYPSALSVTNLAVYNGNDAGGYGFGVGNGNGSAGSKLQGLFGGVTWIDSGYTFGSTNVWYHVVMTRDGTTTRFYVDGVPTTGTSASTPGSVNSRFSIGMQYSNTNVATRFFSGNVDDFRVYDRTLNIDEIRLLAQDPGTIAVTNTLTSTPSTSFASEEKSVGPVAYWAFDEGVGSVTKDATRNGNNGTITAATWKTEDLCISGKCLYFDNSTAYVNNGNPTSLNFSGTSPFTLSAWIKPSAANETGNIISKYNSGVSGQYYFQLSSGKLLLHREVSPYFLTGTTTLTANKWYLATAVYDGTNMQLFLNGVPDSVTQASGSVGSDSTSVLIGAIYVSSTPTEFFNGFIDEPKIYNYARSAAQIQADYNSKSAGTANGNSAVLGAQTTKALNDGLTGYWKMDDNVSGNAKTITDSSGAGNNGSTNDGANDGGMDCTFPGKFYRACHFDAVDDYISVSNTLSGVQTIAFWASASAKTIGILDLNGTATVTATNGVISANNFTTPTIYINATPSATIPAINTWQHIVITTPTGLTASAITLGRVASTYYGGKFDDFRMYNRSLSPDEITQLYNFGPSPVASWAMEEKQGGTITDSINNIASSTFTGPVSWSSGKYGSGLTFKNSDAVVRIPETSVVDLGGFSDSYTVSYWTKTRTTIAGTKYLVAKDDNSGAYPFRMTLTATWLPTFIISDGTITRTVTGLTAVNDGFWHNVVGIRDAISDRIYLYVDGVPVATTTDTTTTTLANDDNISIGNGSTGYIGGDYEGSMDEVKIYNYALNQRKIVEMMNADRPETSLSGSASYWAFEEGSGTTAFDSGTKNIRGTLNAMASPASVGTSGWQKDGKFGGALAFDGVDDYVDLGDLTYTETATGLTTAQMSWSFWVRPNALAVTTCIYCKYNNAATQRSIAIATGTTDSSAIRVTVPTSLTQADNTTYGETPAGALSVGIWTHVVVVHDGTLPATINRLKIYINGRLQRLTTAGSVPATLLASTSNARLGSSSDGARFFAGMIDEFKIYSGILTPIEVDSNYGGSALTLGAFSDTSGVAGGAVASNSASAIYCVPGDTSACSGPVGEWNFEEKQGTVNDTSGNNNTGTWNGPSREHWTTGKYGGGGTFNGMDSPNTDYVSVPDAAILSSTIVTLSAWIKFPTNPTVNRQSIISKYFEGNSASSEYNMWLTTDGTIQFSGNGTNNITTAVTLSPNVWHQVVGVINGASSAIYVDGFLKASGTVTAGSNTTTTFRIGWNENADSGNGFKGQIDNVRIFNYARNASQVAWDYNRGLPVAHWDLDECQGSVINDLVGTNSGTITIGSGGSQTSTTNMGTCTDSSASTPWYNGRNGKFNSSLNFDGTDDYASIPYNSAFNTSAGMTVSTWFNTTSTDRMPLVSHENGASTPFPGYNLTIKPNYGCASSAGQIGFWLGDDTNKYLCTTNAYNDGNWHFVAGTYDGTTAFLYVDGKLQSSGARSNGTNLISQPFNIGTITVSGTPYYFDGRIDDVRVYNYALTATQIRTLYNQNAGVRFGPTSGSP